MGHDVLCYIEAVPRWLARLWISGAVCGSCSAALHAQAEPRHDGGPMRVIVRVCNARDQQALARLRGQTSDLAVELVVREPEVLEPLLGQQLDRAEALAAELDAAAVVWFDSAKQGDAEQGSILVYVATPQSGRVLARRLDAGSRAADGPGASKELRAREASALLEQSALVVRFALKGLSQGGTIGVDRSDVEQSALPSAAARPQVAPLSQPAPVAPPPSEPPEPIVISDAAQPSRPGPLWLGLGYEVAADGFAPAGHHALAARASWETGALEAGVQASVSLPVAHPAALATLRMQRARAGAALAWVVPLSARASIAAGGQASVLLQRRETIEPGPEVTPRPARWNAALDLGPEASVRLRWGALGLAVTAALDLLPSPTRFVYRSGDQELQSAQPWLAQPRFTLVGEVSP